MTKLGEPVKEYEVEDWPATQPEPITVPATPVEEPEKVKEPV